jgi:hypothetical protein
LNSVVLSGAPNFRSARAASHLATARIDLGGRFSLPLALKSILSTGYGEGQADPAILHGFGRADIIAAL